MYCYYCLLIIRAGMSVGYSYKNGLNQTITGNVLGILQINVLLGILNGGGTEQKYTCNGRQIGVKADTSIAGTYVCSYHLAGDAWIG